MRLKEPITVPWGHTLLERNRYDNLWREARQHIGRRVDGKLSHYAFVEILTIILGRVSSQYLLNPDGSPFTLSCYEERLQADTFRRCMRNYLEADETGEHPKMKTMRRPERLRMIYVFCRAYPHFSEHIDL